jgi:hypothetical protein
VDPAAEAWLAAFVARNQGVAGSVHVHRDGALHMTAAFRLPPPVIEATRFVPSGKGMAGLALQQDRAIQTCNLQTDQTGNVKPGAKAVNAQGAVAFPVHATDGSVRAVVGIAWMDERVLDDAALKAIAVDGSTLPD